MNEQLSQFIHHVVDRLQAIEGIVAIALGGSRARGTHTPKSDVDLGIYVLFALNEMYLLNEKGAGALANGFTLCPADYQGFGHPVEVGFRESLNGIFYVQRTGCHWEMMPHDLPPYSTVYSAKRSSSPPH